MDFKRKLSFLQSSGTNVMEHSRGVLLDHLVGTYTLLKNWGDHRIVCDAGLFHSIYGTESYPSSAIPLELRPAVQKVIGVEAEMLAYLFGMKQGSIFCAPARRSAQLQPNQSLRNSSSGLDQNMFKLQHRLTGEWMSCTPEQMINLANITIANALEQALRLPHLYQDDARDFFLSLRPLALPAAQKAIDAFFKSEPTF